MDAQGRGRADDVDPADQWVLNPRTGEYELRLPPSAPQSPVPGPRRPAPRTGGASSPADGAASGTRRTAAPGREVPPQRRRRSAPEEPAPGRRGRRPAKKSKGKKALLWAGGSTAFVVLVAGVGGYLYLKHLEGNVTTTDVGSAGSSSFKKDEAFNILIIGTDKRTGAGNEGYGDKGSVGHADTTILLHVAEDRSNATALSIPRDLIVDIPDCETTQEDGSTEIVPGEQDVRFNRSLGEDGRDAGCTMRTVAEATGIKPDHFMMADFNAVKTLTTAVDGVDVCVEKAVDDPKSHLKLPAGESKVEGEQALAFVRTRHAFGNEGDLDRIKVQQQFLGSLMRKMASGDTLTSPTKLVKLAEAATKALTVDKPIGNVGTLKDIALELKKVPTKNITFMTVPVIDNPAEPKPVTVVLKPGTAEQVFSTIRNDISFTEVEKKEKAAKKKEAAAVAARLEGEKSDPSEVRVRILNGGAPAGSAQQELNYLQTTAGVTKSENAGNAQAEAAKTTLEYAPDQADQARALAEILGLSGAAMKPGESVTNAQGLPTMTLTLGKDFKGPGVKLDATSVETPDVDKTTADQKLCAS
ncbi:LCP family protein [Streptomyces rochei]|uniref:LCP family protein n=5 Tax=Streptomyces TaxID=1883 RepID=A0ABW7E7L4_STRRO|nr:MULTISPECIES: LCP family protein [Streptomyces]WDI18766.1 LCP family protein [Streptomyces enissocaesilis]MBU8556899.1 LCP family protein [Streptomyces sp. Babs14]MCC8455269.1 LCP family protein [Streptomyces rochei]MDI3099621.1 LCP family protein [Streptomyces sp. AN-3]PVD05988.1 LytR family transcriptional regulator [Streptomyces sp. CS207]